MEESLANIVRQCWAGEVRWQFPMSRMTTYKVGGPAEAVLPVKNEAETVSALKCFSRHGVNVLVLGHGSNVLVHDDGIQGVVMVMGKGFSGIHFVEDENHPSEGKHVFVTVEAGCSLPKFVQWTAAHGLSGVEFAAGIPGSVGGAVIMNAGAWGTEICDVLAAVTLIEKDGSVVNRQVDKQEFAYRRWLAHDGQIVLSGIFRLERSDKMRVAETIKRYNEERRNKQPVGQASAGSVFKNPPGLAAGALIEQVGLKGTRCGGAMISDCHANFIVNTGNATATDIFSLMMLARDKVMEKKQIKLEPEIVLLGNWPKLES